MRAKILSDEAEDDGFGYSKARTTTKYGAIFAATLRAGANFTDFVVARRWQILNMRRSSILELGEIGSQRHRSYMSIRPSVL